MSIVRLLGFKHAEASERGKSDSRLRNETAPATSPVEAAVAQIEEDTRLAMRLAGDEAAAARKTIRAAGESVEGLRTLAEVLAIHSASSRDTCAAAAEALEAAAASPDSIHEALATAHAGARAALISGADAEARHAALGEAVEGVERFVPVFAAIARESQIVAMNTALASARSGSDARRFEGMAEEIERLASRTRRVAEELREQVRGLRIAGAASVAASASVVESIRPIEPALMAISIAKDEATCRSREAAARAADAANRARTVAEDARELERAANGAARAASQAGRAGDDAVVAFDRFAKRASVSLRTSQFGNRRRFDRAPVRIPGAVFLAGARSEACALDVSEGGALLSISGRAPRARDRLRLCLGPAGDCPATVVAVSEVGHHVEFENPPAAMLQAIRQIVADAASTDDGLALAVKMAAAQTSRAFDNGIALGDVGLDDLFSTDYRPIEGVYPVRWENRATSFFERVLRPILSDQRDLHPNLEFVIATDRNSYAPIEVRPSRERSDLATFNMEKRIVDIAALAAGSRSTAPIFIYLLPCPAGENSLSPLKAFSAPIWVAGKLWGAIQIGRKF